MLRDDNWRLLALFVWLLALAACSRGPDAPVASDELTRRLDNYFESDLFEVRSFKRMGSAPFRDVEAGTSGLFIYYNAELAFEKDYNLTDWRGLNLGTLAYVLGATELGVQGFETRGNERGDILKVYGRLAYGEDEEGNWVAIEGGSGVESIAADTNRDMISQGPEATLDEVRKMLTAAPTKLTGTRAAIVREFKGSVGQIDLRLASERGDITLGGGPVNGTYQAFSDAFSRFATAQGVPVHSFSSEGSVENASRIQAGSLDFALVQSDVAQLFYRGWVDKTVLPSHDLRTVASLWPEAVHLITLDGSGIETIADLKGRRLAIGVRGSGTRLNALILGLAAGLGEDEVPQIREIGRDEAIRALERGEIDALFLTEAVPAPSLQRLARRRRDVKLVPIDVALVESLSERFFPYYPLVIEARTYPLQTSPYITLGLAAVLMTNQHVADEAVVQMLELLLRGSDEMASQYYRAAFVTRETMRLGVEVPLHAAAQQFYNDEEVGELVTPGEGVAELSDSTQVSPEH